MESGQHGSRAQPWVPVWPLHIPDKVGMTGAPPELAGGQRDQARDSSWRRQARDQHFLITERTRGGLSGLVPDPHPGAHSLP